MASRSNTSSLLAGAARQINTLAELLVDTNVLFLTQDEDFLFDDPTEAVVVLSRVRQSRPLAERAEICRRAILDLNRNPRLERRFEVMDDGSLVTWEQGPGRSWAAKIPPKGAPDS